MNRIVFCGRGPSSSLHIGHLICYEKIAKYAKENNLPILFQFSSDEKYYRDRKKKESYSEQVKKDLVILNSIFKDNNVFFFDSLEDLCYNQIFKRELPRIKLNYFLPSFGLKGLNDPLEIIYPYIQAIIPILLSEWGVEVIEVFSGKDQNPYFELALKLKSTLKIKMNEIEFLSSLNMQNKMTSSTPESCLFLEENTQEIRAKIRKASSGAGSVEEHTNHGLLRDKKDFCYEFLKLSEYDDNLMKQYKTGRINSEETKKLVFKIIVSRIDKIRRRKVSRIVPTRRFNKEAILRWIQN